MMVSRMGPAAVCKGCAAKVLLLRYSLQGFWGWVLQSVVQFLVCCKLAARWSLVSCHDTSKGQADRHTLEQADLGNCHLDRRKQRSIPFAEHTHTTCGAVNQLFNLLCRCQQRCKEQSARGTTATWLWFSAWSSTALAPSWRSASLGTPMVACLAGSCLVSTWLLASPLVGGHGKSLLCFWQQLNGLFPLWCSHHLAYAMITACHVPCTMHQDTITLHAMNDLAVVCFTQ